MFMAVMMMVHAFGQRIARQPAKMAVIITPASVLIAQVATAPMSISVLEYGDGVAKRMNVINSIHITKIQKRTKEYMKTEVRKSQYIVTFF